jgi:hypothetical protein
MTSSAFETGTAPTPPGAGIGETLAWDAFAARYFPERRRHDMEAIAAYGAYNHGRDWRNAGPQKKSPPRLTLVPSEPIPSATEAEAKSGAGERLLVAIAAAQVWEGEGGRTV